MFICKMEKEKVVPEIMLLTVYTVRHCTVLTLNLYSKHMLI